MLIKRKNKYRNKIIYYNNFKFHSIKEYNRYKELYILQSRKIIKDLKLQVKYDLIPAYPKIQRAISYIADFTYKYNNELIVEDVKGIRTKDYIIKKKLMYHFYKIKIKEIIKCY